VSIYFITTVFWWGLCEPGDGVGRNGICANPSPMIYSSHRRAVGERLPAAGRSSCAGIVRGVVSKKRRVRP